MQRVRLILPYCVLAGFVVWCLTAFRADLTHLSLRSLVSAWDVLLGVALLSLVNYGLRCLRWQGYLARLGHPLPVRFACTTYVAGFAFTLAPGKLGELARARYYRPLGVPVSAVAAAFFVERLVDALVMLLLALLGISLLGRFQALLGATAGAVAVALLALLLWPRAESQLARAGSGHVRLPVQVRDSLSGLSRTLHQARSLLHPAPLLVGFALGGLAWGAEGVGFALLTGIEHPSQEQVHLVPAVGVYAIGVLAGALSFVPGGVGTAEVVMTVLLVRLGLPVSAAMTTTLACRLLTLWFAVLLGWLAIAVLRPASRLVQQWR